MSVESTDLERAALERKDRDELFTIAEAMGGKPGSRASKAKIVDLILELAGVTEPAGADEGDAAQDRASGEAPAEPADVAGTDDQDAGVEDAADGHDVADEGEAAPTKAKDKLGWIPEITLDEMVREMVAHDLEKACRHALLKTHGYNIAVSREN